MASGSTMAVKAGYRFVALKKYKTRLVPVHTLYTLLRIVFL